MPLNCRFFGLGITHSLVAGYGQIIIIHAATVCYLNAVSWNALT